MYDFLKNVPLFADLPEADLDRLCEMVEEVRLEAGKDLFKEGSPGDMAYVIKEGELEIVKDSSGREVLLAVRGDPGTVIGEMALLQAAPRSATVRARKDTTLLAIHQAQLDQLLNTSSSAARAMLHTVLARWRATEAIVHQSEKMAQLGTMTAGIAHELNNPAAAVKRSSGQLQQTMSELDKAQAQLAGLELSDAQQGRLKTLAEEARQNATRPPEMDALARSDREYEFEEWLEDLGVDEAWALAPMLVNLDYDTEQTESLASDFDPEQLATVIRWLGTLYDIHNLLAEIGQGAERISGIVKALKTYSFLDQAPVQTVDVHKGLDDTLLILRNKLRSGNISVRREYDPELPKIQAYGSELNQLWTNIIDNAADALENKEDPREIVIRTQSDNGWINVEIEDNGPGIPESIQSKVYDPFFTTKPPGKGTGLGLNISYNIVVEKHRGDIKVFSRPGKTRFMIKLPVNFEDTEGGTPQMEGIERASDEELRQIFETTKTVAVVGLSNSEGRPAHSVPAYLKSQGYRIIPVNPRHEEILGEKSFSDLISVPEPVDVVEIFRPSEEAPEIVEEAIQIGAKVVWMQEGIVNEQAAERARNAGLQVVMDTCMRATHKRLYGTN